MRRSIVPSAAAWLALNTSSHKGRCRPSYSRHRHLITGHHHERVNLHRLHRSRSNSSNNITRSISIEEALYSRRHPISHPDSLTPLLGGPSSQWSLSSALQRRSTTESLQDVSCDYYHTQPSLHTHQPSLEVGGMEGGEAALRQKCKALKDEYDTLHKCYADLVQVHSSHVSKMELSQEDMARLKKQLDDAKRERDAALRECAGLQQQCTAAIRQWDNALRERNDAREQLQRTQQQRDDAMKEINQAMAIRLKAGKDLNRLTEERNAAVQEYALIMSERDSVHKEMEKFQEELATKNSELSTSENKIKSLQDENEGLKREIASALQDRDRALKECNQLRECSPLQKQHEQDSQAYKDQIEALHKEVTKLKNELTEAQQEAEVSKRRRDWAFSERDKIVLERESIRALCDRLRKERDRAVSELAEALRDSDDAKRQANKELNELRQMQLGVALSKDSAIDIMEEFEASTKTVKLKLDGLENGGGFETCKNNDTLWVSRIEAGGPADGKLLLQDQIIKINGASVFQMGVEVAQEMLQKATDYLKLEVRRRASSQHKHSSRRGYFFCELQIPEKETHGLVLEAGVYVAQTVPGTPGAQVLQAGDRILSIDGQVVTDMQLALEKLDKPGRFQLQVCRFGNSINSSSKNDDTKDRSANIILKQFSSVCVQTDEKLAKTLVSPSEKKASNTLLDRAKNKIFGEKKSTRPLSTIQSSNDTKEAIFELDSVIDRFSSERKSAKSHKGSSTSSSKENHRGTSSAPNNGGTWPKYKGALTEHQLQAGEKVSLNVNTLQTTHKRKERKSIPKQFYHSSSDSSPVSSGSSPIKMDAYVPQTSSEILREFNSLVQTAPSSRNHSQDRYYSMTTPRPHSKPLAVKGSSGLVTAQTSSMQVSTRPRSAHYTASILDGSYGSHYGAHSAGNGSVKESAYEMILPAPLEPSALNSLNPLNTLNPLNPHGALGGHGTHSAASHHGGHGGAHNPLYPNYYTTGSSHSTRHAISAVGHVGPVCCPPGPGPYMSRSGDSLLSAGAESSSTNTFTPSTGYGIKDSSHYSGGSYTPSPCPSSLAAYQTSYSPTYGIEFGHFHGAPYPGPHVPPIPPLHADHGALGGTHAHVHGAHMSVMHASGGVGGTGIGGGAPTTADVGVSIAGLATFPKRQQRIRIPSTPSVSSSAGRVSTGSIDREHQHRPASPLQPALTVELINSSGGDIELNPKNRKPKAGDTRRIIIEKSKEPLGIQIKGGAGQSIFVSSVTENSLAEKAGLQIGDQLLEVCGINMRNATYQLAANVLRQCRDSMTMLVQFNPDKYREGCSTPGGASSSASESPPDTPHASPKTQYRQSQSGTAGSGPNVTMATGGVVVVSGSGNGSSSVTKRHRSPGAAGPSVCVDAREARSRSNDDLSSAGGNSTLTRSSHKSVGGGVGGTVYLPQPLQAHGHSHTKMVGSGGEPSSGNSGGSKREPTAVSSIGAVGSSVSKGGVRCDSSKPTEPRVVVLNKPSSSNLGITLLGGNAVGIFVHSVEPDSPAATGLRPGDQILEYNGIDLRNFTAEDAASELAKPTGESAQLKVLVQENMERYMEIQEYGSGDAFYVRALFDRPATDGSLPIKKDDVFFVDNTMYKGVNGLWRAWLVDQEGRKSRCGFIPSRYKAEEELVLRRSLLDMAADEAGRRGSARRSFFRRRSKNASTREIAAYSDASINSSSYSAGSAASMLAADELLPPPTYQRVEKLCYTSFRPVILIGPLNDAVMEKLEQDYPDMFQRCLAEAMRGTPHLMEKGVSELKILDFQRRGSHFECTTISAIKAICEQSHAFLDVSLSLDVIIERLKKCQIYPIVIFIKFKSTKQIREVKDCRYLTEKMTTKAAKEMFEHSVKIESEYKHLINGVIQGNNLTYMCTQVKTCVEDQQNKTVWISTASVQY